MISIQRLLGKVTLTANFETTATRGYLEGRIHDLSLDGKSVNGEILFPNNVANGGRLSITISGGDWSLAAIPKRYNIGNINGIQYEGKWRAAFTGERASDNSKYPSGIVGTIGGTGTDDNFFIASFGAKKMEEEP